MTCVVGLSHKRTVYIGADSLGCSGDFTILRSDRKVFRNGPYTMGICGSYRMGNVLQHYTLPEPPMRNGVFRFMCCEFVDAVREAFARAGIRKKENEVEQGHSFVVGFGCNLFFVDGDFQVGVNSSGFIAIGSGLEIATGSLWATRKLKMKPEQRIREAILAAAEFNSGVRGPVHVMRAIGGAK